MRVNELPAWFLPVIAGVFGALWGSFANVVIYRWPRGMSVVLPGSHCFACKKPVAAWDNIPILSYLLLRGRCRHCHARFSPRYAVIELVFGLIALAIMRRVLLVGGSDLAVGTAVAHGLVRFAVAAMLLIATFIDLDHMLVPWFVKWIAPVPLIASWWLPSLAPSVSFPTALLGAAIGYLGLRLLFIDGYKVLTGRRGMGLGDAEVLLVVGTLLGPGGVVFALGAGAVQGLLFAGIAALFGRSLAPLRTPDVEAEEHPTVTDEPTKSSEPTNTQDDEEDEEEDEEAPASGIRGMRVPFVPFLTLGAMEYLLGADGWIQSYLQWTAGDR